MPGPPAERAGPPLAGVTVTGMNWWRARGQVLALVAYALFFVGLDLVVFGLGSRTTGSWGPAAGLVLRLVLDVSLIGIAWSPFAAGAVVVAGCSRSRWAS